MIGHFEEKNENKYLTLDDVDENKKILKKYKEVWDGIKKEIETSNGGGKIEYGKNKKKKKRFESNDDLSLNEPIKLCLLTIIIWSVFSEDSKFYSQLFLHDALYELEKCYSIKKFMFQNKLM